MQIEQRQWIYDESCNAISVERREWLEDRWQPHGSRWPLSQPQPLLLYYNNMQSVFEWVDYCYMLTASYIKVSGGNTGVENVKTESPIQIHSSGKTIFVNSETGKNTTISVYGITGVKVAEQTTASQTTTIEMPASGFYIVSVKTEKEKPVTAKLAIK